MDVQSIKNRATPSSSIHLLLDHLRDLQVRMNNVGGNPGAMNVIEAYDYFIRESDSGRNCPMALKALKLFSSEDYQEIRKMIELITEDLRCIDSGR